MKAQTDKNGCVSGLEQILQINPNINNEGGIKSIWDCQDLCIKDRNRLPNSDVLRALERGFRLQGRIHQRVIWTGLI